MAQFKNYLILVAIVIYTAYICNNVSAEVQDCDEVLLNNDIIIAYSDKKLKSLWKYARDLSSRFFNSDDLHEVVHRYFKYLRAFKKFAVEKILSPISWCGKIHDLCIESLRMSGFRIEEYVPKSENLSAFHENMEKARNMDPSESGVIGEYVHFMRTQDIKTNDNTIMKWCYKKCAANMEEHGFGKGVHKSVSNLIENFDLDRIHNQSGCAKLFTQYYLIESKNISKCLRSDMQFLPSTIDHWCSYQCI